MSSSGVGKSNPLTKLATWVKENPKKAKIAAGVGITLLVLGILAGLATFAIHKYVGFSKAGQWIQNQAQHQWQVLSHGFNQLMDKKLTVGQSLLYFGLPSLVLVGTVTIAGVALLRRGKAHKGLILEDSKKQQ